MVPGPAGGLPRTRWSKVRCTARPDPQRELVLGGLCLLRVSPTRGLSSLEGRLQSPAPGSGVWTMSPEEVGPDQAVGDFLERWGARGPVCGRVLQEQVAGLPLELRGVMWAEPGGCSSHV